MKRLLVFAAAVVALSLVGSGRLLAQTAEGDPFLGAWRLNLAQSKIESLPPIDKPLVLTVQGQSDARLFILEGITTDEKNIAFSFLIDWDGSEHPAGTAPGGLSLHQFRLRSPEAGRLCALFRALGLDLNVENASRPAISAVLRGPRGQRLVLGS